MKKFEHYLLTKFNIGLYSNKKTDKNGRKIDDDQWMKHRLKLFKKYCFPSIIKQTNQNFQWLVLFDRRTPKKYLDKINEFKKYKPLILCFGGWFDEIIKKNLDPNTKYLITTRIDNDDAFNIRAIEVIQKQFHEQDCLLINFPIGYCLDVNNKCVFLNGSISNPFISLIEKVKKTGPEINIKTVRCMNHSHLNQLGEIKQVETTVPMWVQVIHERNLANQARGKPFPLEQLRKKDFGLN